MEGEEQGMEVRKFYPIAHKPEPKSGLVRGLRVSPIQQSWWLQREVKIWRNTLSIGKWHTNHEQEVSSCKDLSVGPARNIQEFLWWARHVSCLLKAKADIMLVLWYLPLQGCCRGSGRLPICTVSEICENMTDRIGSSRPRNHYPTGLPVYVSIPDANWPVFQACTCREQDLCKLCCGSRGCLWCMMLVIVRLLLKERRCTVSERCCKYLEDVLWLVKVERGSRLPCLVLCLMVAL